MQRIYLGIDNGINGGIAALDEDGNILLKCVMPKIPDLAGKGFVVNDREICRIVKNLVKQGDVTVSLEKYLFAKQANALAKMADCFATIRTITHLLGLPFQQVTPRQWQGDYFKKPKGAKDWNTKQAALKAAKEIWQGESFRATPRSTTPHDGIVDALLIAHHHLTSTQNDLIQTNI